MKLKLGSSRACWMSLYAAAEMIPRSTNACSVIQSILASVSPPRAGCDSLLVVDLGQASVLQQAAHPAAQVRIRQLHLRQVVQERSEVPVVRLRQRMGRLDRSQRGEIRILDDNPPAHPYRRHH